ncbi:hypothetical protein FOZ62_014950 [Perkinsus olseni]|uniref:Uncharacterized protein n=1 Tax=Perkinsus olseni TaxID=32597 RepID=A0A7J6PZF3_PEROL|nr:hypothetical protein FOZ62_014950 [Perkinsus olseni]
MRSTLSRCSGLLVGALLLTVGASKDDYTCHFPDDPTEPISCLVSAVPDEFTPSNISASRFYSPYLYSEHTVITDEYGIQRYKSICCAVTLVGRPNNFFFASWTGPCDIEWLEDDYPVAFTVESSGVSTEMRGPNGWTTMNFKRIDVKEVSDLPFPRNGKRGDVVARYVNDEPVEWEARVILGSNTKWFYTKRNLHVDFCRVDGAQLWIVPIGVQDLDGFTTTVGPNREILIGGSEKGKAFFFEHGSNTRPGKYAVFVTISDKAYILFNGTARSTTFYERRGSADSSVFGSVSTSSMSAT